MARNLGNQAKIKKIELPKHMAHAPILTENF